MNIIRKIYYSRIYITIVNWFVLYNFSPLSWGKEKCLAVFQLCACFLDLDQ